MPIIIGYSACTLPHDYADVATMTTVMQVQSLSTTRVLSTGGGGVGGKVLPQTQHLSPQKFLN